MKQLLLVFLGGGLGSSLRYYISVYITTSKNGFPYGTFAVNIIGSFLIGLILGYALKNSAVSQPVLLFLVTGFCGGFTTFSAFAYENVLFLKAGDVGTFLVYALASFTLCLLAVFAGLALIKYV